MDSLRRVQRATQKRTTAEEEWRASLRAAHADGLSLREIARAASVSHTRVLQIVRGG